jgi:hypothetical protein
MQVHWSLYTRSKVFEWQWFIGRSIDFYGYQRISYHTKICCFNSWLVKNIMLKWITFGISPTKVRSEKQRVTAIITPWGLYRFLSSPLEFRRRREKYQARMAHQVLKDFHLNGSIVYIDDTVIYGENDFLWKCWIWWWRGWPNSMFASSPTNVSSVHVFSGVSGHIFDEHGVHLSEKRVQGIQEGSSGTSYVQSLHNCLGSNLILYTDASTKAIGVFMQVQGGR